MSEIEQIVFPQDTAERKRWFTSASFSHPAKMHLSLQMYLIEHYTKKGDTILDPMTGSGTILVACALERNVICVELEEKFVGMIGGFECDGKIKGYKDVWMEPIKEGWVVDVDDGYYYSEPFETKEQAENWAKEGVFEIFGGKHEVIKTEISWQEGKEGYCTKEIIPARCGKRKNHKPHFVEGNWQKIKSLGPMLGYKMGEAVILQGDARNLPQVLADCAIFSPPYAEALDRDEHKHSGGRVAVMLKDSYLKNKQGKTNGQIANLPYGSIPVVISSPPYNEEPTCSESYKRIRSAIGRDTTKPSQQYQKYAGKADVICTSPPYEGSLEATSRHKKDKICRDKRLSRYEIKADLDPSIKRLREHGRTDDKAGGPYGRSLGHPYSGAAENIGNLKSESYLQAMLLVYQNCHRVLKDRGLMVLVTKNFIRDKKIVQLDLDTIKLCEQAGFTLIERLKRKLTQISFWRRIYQQRYPNAPTIDFEDVLVFRAEGIV